MKKITLIIILLVAMSGIAAGQARQPEWFTKLKQIELLKSTYSSVVELFGEPKHTESSIIRTFKTNDGRLSITLSTGKCGTPNKKGYNVDTGVVEGIYFYVKKESRVKAGNLGVKLSKFKKFQIDDVPGAYSYENAKSGIYIGIDRDGLVEDILFSPNSDFEKILCK